MDRFERLPESERVDRYTGLARKALSGYGLDGAGLTHLGGAKNVTFEVVTGDPARHYALRICPPDRTLESLQREILWLIALCRDTDLAAPEPILATDGQPVHKVSIAGVPGFRPCVLLRWVDGKSLDRELTADHLRRVGRLTARLHRHAESFRWPEEITPPRRNATLMSEVLDEGLLRSHYPAEALDPFRAAIDLVATTMARLRDGPDVAGVIHGELHRRNVLFREDEARAIGYESCRWGYYAYDLAVIRGWIERREQAEELIAALLEGYRALRDFPDEVERSVPAFAALRLIDRIQSILSRPDREGRTTLDQEREKLLRIVEAA